MASPNTPPFPPSFPVEVVKDKSVLKCYMLRSSACAFLVKTPNLGYEAIFLRLGDDVWEPDMLLTMHHHNKTHKVPWLSPFLQDRTYARLETLLASHTASSTTAPPNPSHNLRSTAAASSSAQSGPLDPDLAKHLQTVLKPWPEPTRFYEAVTHVLGWLWGVGLMFQLEGRTEEMRRVEKMIVEIEHRFKAKRS
ncbi:MAG: hypothetical protein Q9191_008460, partial [Dirinaria sp. TL-2023a]